MVLVNFGIEDHLDHEKSGNENQTHHQMQELKEEVEEKKQKLNRKKQVKEVILKSKEGIDYQIFTLHANLL